MRSSHVYWPHRKRNMPSKSSSSSGVAVLDRERVPAELRHVITTVVTQRAGVREGYPSGQHPSPAFLRVCPDGGGVENA